MWLRISKDYKVEYVSEILARYYVMDNRISTNLDNVLNGNISILSKYECHLMNNKKMYSNQLKHIGMLYAFRGDYKVGLHYLRKSISINYLNLKAIVFFLLLKVSRKHFKSNVEYFCLLKSKGTLIINFDK